MTPPAPPASASAVVRAVLAAPAVLLLVATGAAHLRGGRRGGGDDATPARGPGDRRGGVGMPSLEHRHGHGQPPGAPPAPADSNNNGNAFDFYVYSMSHQPEFCRENGARFAGCRAPRAEWRGQLTIHGLWPNRDDGTWPSTCSDEAFDPALLADLAEDLAQHWPNIKALSPDAAGHNSFWEHEWTKHGTCSGLGQQDYFNTALDLFLRTPDVVLEHYGAVVAREDLAQDPYLGGDMSVFVCKQGSFLSEVRVCYERMPDGAVGERASCPGSTLREDSCGDEIRIASFDAAATSAVA